jgi:hypothetical protein
MKAACLVFLALNIAVLAAAYVPHEAWAYRICDTAFGVCDYPWILAFGVAAWVGMLIMLKEIN